MKNAAVKLIISIFFSTTAMAQDVNLIWANQIGSPNNETAQSIALDASENVYTTGFFVGTVDFDPGAASYPLTAGTNDPYIQKTTAAGNFLWAKHFTGTGYAAATVLAVDNSGNLYVAGNFYDTMDFDPGAGVFNLTATGGNDIYVCKLDASGNFIWAKKMGGTANDMRPFLKTDATGNVYITGVFNGTVDFGSGFIFTSNGAADVFTCKINPAGTTLWANQTGGPGDDNVNALALDAAGNVYLAGYFSATVDFNPGAATFTLTSAGMIDAFVSKLDASGNFVWAKRTGGTGNDYLNAVTLDNAGNIYMLGAYTGPVDLDPGSGVYNLVAPVAACVTKLSAAGNFAWAKEFIGSGGNSYDYIDTYTTSVITDAAGHIYLNGAFSGTCDFDPSSSSVDLAAALATGESTLNRDIFLCKLDTAGNFMWIKQMGSAGDDLSRPMVIGTSGSLYMTGVFTGTVDFDPELPVWNLSADNAHDLDAFTLKLNALSTGIAEEAAPGSGATVFPNPNTGSIFIRMAGTTETLFTLYDITGKMAFTEKSNAALTELHLNAFANGIYYLQIEGTNERTVQKIVLSR